MEYPKWAIRNLRGIILLCLFFTSVAKAGCPQISLSATNALPLACELKAKHVIHGIMYPRKNSDIALGSVNQEYSKGKQFFWGPEFAYSYNCGGWQLAIHVQKDFCFFKAGHINTFKVSPQGAAVNALTIADKTTDDGQYCFFCKAKDGTAKFTLQATDPGENLHVSEPTAVQTGVHTEDFSWIVSSTKDLGFSHHPAGIASQVIVDQEIHLPARSCIREGNSNAYHCSTVWQEPAESSLPATQKHTWQIVTRDAIYSAGTDGRVQTFQGPDFVNAPIAVSNVHIVADASHPGKYKIEGNYDLPSGFSVISDADNYIEIADINAPTIKIHLLPAIAGGCVVHSDCYFSVYLGDKPNAAILKENHIYNVTVSFNYAESGVSARVYDVLQTQIATNTVAIEPGSVQQTQMGGAAKFNWRMQWSGTITGVNYGISITDPSVSDKKVDGIAGLVCINSDGSCSADFTTQNLLVPGHRYNYTVNLP